MGRLANRLLQYFKECWSEYQPNATHLDDDDMDISNHRENSLRKSNMTTRDKNNNTKTRKNYRQLAGLSDDDDFDNATEYTPMPSSKRVRALRPRSILFVLSFFRFIGSSFSSASTRLHNCGSRLSCIYCLS